MLQCKLAKSGAVELTDKKTVISLDGPIARLDDQRFDSPGEYESRGIEIIYGQNSMLLVWERLQIVYVFSPELPTGFEKAQFASCDVLVLNAGEAEINKSQLTALTDAYDPSVLIVGRATIEAATKESLKLQPTDQVKLAAQTLPTEGRDAFQLT